MFPRSMNEKLTSTMELGRERMNCVRQHATAVRVASFSTLQWMIALVQESSGFSLPSRSVDQYKLVHQLELDTVASHCQE